MWSFVKVDDCMDRVVFLVVLMDLDDNSCCFLYFDVFFYCVV